MNPRRPVSTVRDYRPPVAGAARTTGAPAGATRGGSVAAPRPGSHEAVVRDYPDDLLDSVIACLGKRNLRDQSDHETRWCAERCKAARAERRRRKAAAPAP